MNSVLLKAVDISKKYSKGSSTLEVLKGVSLEIMKGEFVGIAGSSGAGKSTLLHILGTLDSATSGQVFFEDLSQPITKRSADQIAKFRNRSLGFIFQFHHLIPELTAQENVMLPALIAGHAFDDARRQADELLAFVGLGSRTKHLPAELSGGEQQRVAIARAVVLRPQLILADELTGNLDTANRDQIMLLLKRLNKETGVTVLVVSHDPQVVQMADRVLTMRDGRFV